MVKRRKVPSVRQSQRVSRDVEQSMIGSHVQRPSASSRRTQTPHVNSRTAQRASHGQVEAIRPRTSSGESYAAHRQRTNRRQYADAVQHRARTRRVGLIAVIIVVLAAVALLAGFLAFRGTVGSEMALRDSDASQALVSVRSEEPYYALIAVELGAAAKPLEQAGPDVLLLARVDRENKSLALVGIPAGLQVATDAGTRRVADLAQTGDAALIGAVSSFVKVDISHYVKVGAGGLEGIVDALGGIDVNIDQVIDDPHAGDVYLPVGTYTLNGASALTYLRANNLRLGATDQFQHQVDFAALLLAKVFSNEGNFATRIDSIGPYFQTDLSLGDIETLHGIFGGMSASDIQRTVLPGYLTEVTGVVNTGDALFVGSSDDMANIIEALESGTPLETTNSTEIQPASPANFTVEVQNGTNIVGAAAVTADTLTAAGFNVTKTGNAEQPVYDETLVVYKGAEGPSRAKAVINALGLGRAVDGEVYYKFDDDILVIVGSDYKPFV